MVAEVPICNLSTVKRLTVKQRSVQQVYKPVFPTYLPASTHRGVEHFIIMVCPRNSLTTFSHLDNSH